MICNKDCFHCQFDDCVNDEMDAEDRAESVRRDRILDPDDQRKGYFRTYYQRHKKERQQYSKQYYAEHKAECDARNKAWRNANRQAVNRNERERYHRKKAEKIDRPH